MKVKTFNVVEMIAEEAEKQFKPLWQINRNDYAILKEYCEALDELTKEFNAESVEVQIEEPEMEISITLSCNNYVSLPADCRFYLFAGRAKSISFSISENKYLDIKFTFPSIWRRAI